MKSHFKILLLVLVVGCKAKGPLTAIPATNIVVDANMAEDAKVKGIIEPYTQKMAEAMDEIIGFSPAFLEKKKPSSAIGSMMCDAVLAAANESIPYQTKFLPKFTLCLLNYGGIRSTLDSGDITMGEAYQIMPFENEVVVLKMESRYLDTLKAFVEAKGGEPLSKINKDSYNITKTDKSSYFYLVTNDYVANGGDNYSFLLEAEERITTGIKIRDALITYMKQNNPLPLDYSIRKL